MNAHTATAEDEEDCQVPHRQRLRLEHRLQERDVDQGELNDERGGDGEEKHLVDVSLEEGHVQAAVLKCGSEIEEDERREGLPKRRPTVNSRVRCFRHF